MARRRREKRTFKYECNITGQEFVLTQKADNPDELMSVKAYYELNPEQDDRPELVKKQLGMDEES